MSNLKPFYDTYLNSLDGGEAALFIGAGMSQASGYVNWKSLLRDIANDIGLDVEQESDLVAVAQYHFNAKKNRATLNRKLIEEFTKTAKPSENHTLIATLPIKTIWTTNYDKLIEEAFVAVQKRPAVKSTQPNLAQPFPGHDVAIYKMHGDVSQPQDAVITKHDYETYAKHRGLFIESLQGDLVDKTFLFLGFSFTDPNIDYVLSRLHVFLDQNTREHFCVIRRPGKPLGSAKSKAKMAYERTRHSLRVEDLKRYGITTIEVDDYHEITEILRELNRRGHRRDIFVSGSAWEYSTSFPRERVDELARLLGSEIIKRQKNLVSGFGLGIGSSTIIGAMESLYQLSQSRQEGRTILRPFPQVPPTTMSHDEFLTKHRTDLISQSGSVVFVCGNKNIGGKAVNAPGVLQEFEIAKKLAVPPIPIGSTGYAAQQIWTEVTDNLRSFFKSPGKVKKHFDVLGDSSRSNGEIVDSVLAIVEIATSL